MDNVARHELCALIEDYGPEVCREIDKCRELLLALCGNHPFETILLVQGLEAQIPQDILIAHEGGQLTHERMEELIHRLMSESKTNDEKARWCVATWALALGAVDEEKAETKKLLDLPGELRKAERERIHQESLPPPEEVDPVQVHKMLVEKILAQGPDRNTPLPLHRRRREDRRPKSIKDETDPLAELWRAAETGDPTAKCKMGRIYLEGVIEEQNSQLAVDWLEEAAAAGDGEAWFILGQMYLEGIGVEQDDAEAAYYFENGAEAGHILSMRLFGEMAGQGKGTNQDFEMAEYWLRRASDTANQLRAHAAANPYLFKDIELARGATIRLVRVRMGSFLMGSPHTEKHRHAHEAQHLVMLSKDFWMAETPITQGQWQAVMGNNIQHMRTLAYPEWPLRGAGSDYPMYYVSWTDALEFCNRVTDQTGLLLTLPTEAQWEYACRAGGSTPYWSGLKITPEEANFRVPGKRGKDQRPSTTPVKRYVANPWGLHDMHGNVWEWCHDWFGEYPRKSVRDPKGPITGAKRVVRGGSWLYPPAYLRCAYRAGIAPDFRRATIGFRVVHYRVEY